jgi:hypothetical protein
LRPFAPPSRLPLFYERRQLKRVVEFPVPGPAYELRPPRGAVALSLNPLLLQSASASVFLLGVVGAAPVVFDEAAV